MSLIKRFYLLFLFLVLLPGLFLGYLSFKTIQHEKNLIEKSQETSREEFFSFVEETVREFETNFIDELKGILIKTSTSASQKNYFFLTTDLLQSPFLHSLVILEKDNLAMPLVDSLRGLSPMRNARDPHPRIERAITRIQTAYHAQRPGQCVQSIQDFFRNHYSVEVMGPLGANHYLGFKLLQIKCAMALGGHAPVVDQGLQLLNQILGNEVFAGFRQNQFYLSEILSVLSSSEDLPKKVRDHLWDINLRVDTYYHNIDRVLQDWQLEPDILSKIGGKTLADGLVVFYLDGAPYLKIQFPWVDSRAQVVAKLDPDTIVSLIRTQTMDNPKSPWKSMEYSLYNLNDLLIDNPFGTKNKEPQLERILNADIPQWKIAVYGNLDNADITVGRRKITLLYILTAFAVGILFLGIFTAIKGVLDEKKMVRMKTNFLSAVTHELKSPLTSIRLLSELVGSGRQADNRRIKKYANLIGEETGRLQGMIDNILNSTRLETANLKNSQRPLKLDVLVLEALELMRNNFHKKHIEVSSAVEPDCWVHGDKESLRSVIQNLLDNAIKYSGEHSRVVVRCSKTPKGTAFTVRDQGIGIPANDVKYIFDKFYRAEDEMTRESRGTGLGLALVKQILDFHRAEIFVRSEVGRGSEFTVQFPVCEPEAVSREIQGGENA